MNDLLAAATQLINTTSSHIFLTGKAGTGKTTFLKNIGNITHKNYIVVAPTGIAALNAGGVTIHSQFLLPPLSFLPDRHLPADIADGSRVLNQTILARKHPLNSARKKVLRSIDLLVIDEVSMLRADLLDAIDYRMKAARGNFRQSFGGVQVLFIGDLFQLPPVVKGDELEILSRYYPSAWFYDAKALQDDPLVYLELDKIFRQHDQQFIDILNNLRNNTATWQDFEMLNSHFRSQEEIAQLSEVITLTTHNYKADELNQNELRNLASPSYFFEAHIEGDFPDSMFPVHPKIELKEGAQIMFTRNDTEEKKYFNGKLATVKKISEEEVLVELAGTHEEYSLSTVVWQNKKYSVETETQDLSEEIIGSFEQFPIKLAWAITVHKSQGLTFDRAIIDVGQAFADGQVYVALSRLRSLDGLILRTRINPSTISTDRAVSAFAKANHHPDRLDEVIKVKQQIYLFQLLNNTFDFSLLLKEISYLQKNQEVEAGFQEETMKPLLTQIADALEGEQANTQKFRRQLSDLLNQENPTQLLERVGKGRSYYRSFLFAQIRLLLIHLEVMKHKKRVKAYVSSLTEFDLLLSKKLEEVDTTGLIIEGIMKGQSSFDFDALMTQRTTERAELMRMIRKEIEVDDPPVRKKKTRKSKRDGDKSTYDITLEMFQQGMSIMQIAAERGLVVSTIEGHLSKAVEASRLDIFALINPDELKEIKEVIHHLPSDFISKDLYEALRGKYGYGKLRAVMSHMKKEVEGT
jgi:DNA-binding NarL/FixJ family response regulator